MDPSSSNGPLDVDRGDDPSLHSLTDATPLEPSPTRADDAERPALTRRSLLGSGLGAAALGSSAVVLPSLTGAQRAAAQDDDSSADQRKWEAFEIRVDAAYQNFILPPVAHPVNGDETRYPNRIANYSKGLGHDAYGEVLPDHYDAFLEAVHAGTYEAFESLPSGEPNPALRRPFVNPLAGKAFDLEGIDSHAFRMPDPGYIPSPGPTLPRVAPPTFRSAEQAGEMVEDYWMALLRDVPFRRYATDPLAQSAIADLNALSDFRGPKSHGQVTAQTLFRERMPGTLVGPWVSQFLWKSMPFGSQFVEPRMRTARPGQSFMIDETTWLAVQNGRVPLETLQHDNQQRRYVRNGRDMGEWVHVDVLFQAYFQAALRLLAPPDPSDPWTGGGIGLPANPGNPYVDSLRQEGFGTFGGPHFITLLCEVATRALKAVWFQKWFVHRRLRPEVYAGRIHFMLEHGRTYEIHADVLSSDVLARIGEEQGTYFLPMAFAEGSPMHPSYGAGHGTVAGACVTILKAMFDTQRPFSEFDTPVIASDDGLSLDPYITPGADGMTIEGELNKLAYNVALGRDIAGVHWRSEGIESLRLGEEVAISVLRDQRLTYREPFDGLTFRLFNGQTFTV